MAYSLTSANSILLLGVPNLFPIPQQIQGFAVDDAFGIDAVQNGEVVMGIDNTMSGAWLPVPKKMDIVIQPNSPAFANFFMLWFDYEEMIQDKVGCFGSANFPGLGLRFTLTNGFVTSSSPMPRAKKILQPVQFSIQFQSVQGSPI